MENKRYLILIFVGLLAVGGITYALLPLPANREAEPAATSEMELVPATEVNPPTETAQSVEMQTAVPALEDMPTETVPPTPRTELEGTDPASVNLASGNLQLVELFAFW